MPELASVNGLVTTIADARIPIMDRGFLFGDAAYEVVRVYDKRPFMLKEHLERLDATCRGMRFANPPSPAAIETDCLELLDASGLSEAAFYIHLSRGNEGQGKTLEQFTRPNVVIRCEAPPDWPESYYADGIKLITMSDLRWSRGDLKTVNLLPRILAFEAAYQAQAAEALWVDPDGRVREGLSCNVFAWQSDTLVTPPLTGRILPGIPRSVILKLASDNNFDVRETPLLLDELLLADEVFICSTTRELIPVVSIDDSIIGNGRPGTRTVQLLDFYRALARMKVDRR